MVTEPLFLSLLLFYLVFIFLFGEDSLSVKGHDYTAYASKQMHIVSISMFPLPDAIELLYIFLYFPAISSI